MSKSTSLFALAAVAAVAITAACTPAADTTADKGTDTHTVVETREVASPTVVIEREVPGTPVVIERDGQPAGDSTTVRADRDGISVETTNR